MARPRPLPLPVINQTCDILISPSRSLRRPLGAAFDDELILDTERSRNLARPQSGDGLVALVVHDAEQHRSPVLHDDVNGIVARRLHTGKGASVGAERAAICMAMAPQEAAAWGVTGQEWIAVDPVVGRPTN